MRVKPEAVGSREWVRSKTSRSRALISVDDEDLAVMREFGTRDS